MAGGGSGGVENSTLKNVVLGNLWSRLGILEAFLISPKSLSISLFFFGVGEGGGGWAAPQSLGFLYRRI